MRSLKYSYHKISIFTGLLIGVAACCTTTVKAQLNPLGSQYFQNQYLFNPAMAGIDAGLNVNLAYSKQGIGVEGSQSVQSVSAEYQLKKVGLGVNVFNNLSGLFRTTRAMVTYAYHLPLSGDNQKLNFGISAGIVNQHLQVSEINGDQTDPSLARFNDKQNYVDGDFGVSYTSNKLTIQGTLPNLKTLANGNNTPERELFFTAASYKFGEATNVTVEPKVAYRGIRGFDRVVDAGANVAFSDNAFSLQGMYHSSNSATFGFGFNKSSYSVLAFYTTNTSGLNSYNNGDFEVSLKFNLSGK